MASFDALLLCDISNILSFINMKGSTTMKRILTTVLALMLMLTLCIPAFAEEFNQETGDGKITIENAVIGETYTIYRMADLHSFSGTSFSYKITPGWENFFKTAPSTNWFDINDDGYLVTKNVADFTAEGREAMGKGALVYALDPANRITAVGTKSAESNTVVFDNLPLGWYLVDSSLGVLCSVDTTAKEVVIKEKNEQPTLEKEVQEDSGSKPWGATNSAAIHQVNEFRITIHNGDGSNNYVVHDTMTNMALVDANNDGKIDAGDFTVIRNYALNDTAVDETVDSKNYTVTVNPMTTTDGVDTQSFTVEFENTWVEGLSPNNDIVITYKAALTDNAVIDGVGNPNEAYLEYGEYSKTTPVKTTTYTYAFDLVKTDSAGKLLDGATFELYIRNEKAPDAQDETDPSRATEYDYIKVNLVMDAENVYHVAGPGETPAEVITVVNGGKTTIKGLDLDTYYSLKEITAPAGFNVLAGYTTFRMTSQTGSLTISHDLSDGYQNGEGGVQVINKTGTELPETGGFGTTLFILVGGMLVLGTGVLLATKMRMAKIKD